MTCRNRWATSRCPEARARRRAAAAAVALLLAAALPGCAVKGYELGWRGSDPIAPLLGQPLDPLSGCRHGAGASVRAPACRRLVSAIEALASELPPTRDAPEALGARCGESACSYGNAYERRDIGVALVVPVFRKVVLREARGRFVRRDGAWRLDAFSVTDLPPPGYGPVRIGGMPARL